MTRSGCFGEADGPIFHVKRAKKAEIVIFLRLSRDVRPRFGGSIVIFDFREGLEPTSGKIIQGVLPAEYIRGKQLYIVHSVGELFVITRDGIFNNPRTITNSYGVKQFIVHKVDVDTEHYEKVDDLGNRSFFLGYSASLSVEQYGCKANHICFTDDCFSAFYFHERGGGKDMGVYNLFDNTIESHYTDESCHKFSPLWISFMPTLRDPYYFHHHPKAAHITKSSNN
ncbi:hypothetical protein BC332_34023 [Capsicum chinense]|nr:hypothetical protein BC332_34023 [Capsicum chinense]